MVVFCMRAAATSGSSTCDEAYAHVFKHPPPHTHTVCTKSDKHAHVAGDHARMGAEKWSFVCEDKDFVCGEATPINIPQPNIVTAFEELLDIEAVRTWASHSLSNPPT